MSQKGTAEAAGSLEPVQGALYALTIANGSVNAIDPATGTSTVVASGLDFAPDGVTLDLAGENLIVNCMGVPDSFPTDGSEAPFYTSNGRVVKVSIATGETMPLVGPGGYTTGKQITVDSRTGEYYFCDREGHGVYRCASDGSNLTRLVNTTGEGPSEVEEQCVGVAVDEANGYVYWTQKGAPKGGQGRIRRAPLQLPEGVEAADRTDIERVFSELPEPIDLEVDQAAGLLYWTDRGAEPDGNSLNRAPLPAAGETGGAVEVLARGFREAIGLAIDYEAACVYVSDLSGDIRRVSLTGEPEKVIANLGSPVTGLALR